MPDLDAEYYRKNSSIQYERVHEVLKTIDFKGNETVLDVGCGDGRITAEISRWVHEGEVIGVDPSLSMINLAKNSFHKREFPNLSFKKVKAETLRLEKQVDIILVMNSLHWMREPQKALQNIVPFLKPGGTLFILTYPKESPYWNFLEGVLQEEKWESYAQNSAYKTILRTSEYRQVLEEMGLTEENCLLEENIAVYESAEALCAYIKGWLRCYLPMPKKLESSFLEKAVQSAYTHSLSPDEIHLPYFKLTLNAQKKR